MANDNPKKDDEVDFLRDIIPAFSNTVADNKAFQSSIMQRSSRTLKLQDVGRVFVSVYGNPKGYKDNTLSYHHIFPVFMLLDADSDYVTGMNLFYLPRGTRQKVVTGLLERLNTPQPDVFTKSTFRYELVKNKIQGAIIKPAIKKYIKSRMSPTVVQLSPALWQQIYIGQSADTLESAWQRTTSQKVYRDFVAEVLKEVNK